MAAVGSRARLRRLPRQRSPPHSTTLCWQPFLVIPTAAVTTVNGRVRLWQWMTRPCHLRLAARAQRFWHP